MTKYELMLILNPLSNDAERNGTLDELKNALNEVGAKIEKEDVWWEKKLAYKINSSTTGFYVLYNLEIDGNALKNLTQVMNLNSGIWRHMFVRLDK